MRTDAKDADIDIEKEIDIDIEIDKANDIETEEVFRLLL